MIIGITGTDGAGKGSVVDYLVSEKGFVHYSARAMFVEEIKRQNLPNDRNHMRLVANELRKQHGNDFLITFYLRKFQEEQPAHVIIESLRAVAEAETLKKEGGILLAVDADQKLRYERIQKRGSSSDHVSYEDFEKQEKLESDDPDPNGMQKAKVIQMADYTIMNNGTLPELHKQVDMFLSKYTYEG